MSKKKRQAKRRGFSMLMMLLAVVILFFVGAGSLRLGLDARLLAIRTNHEIEARSAADAGLTKAVFVMNEKLKAKAWSDSTVPSVTNETLPNCSATFSYKVVAKSITSNREFDIVCIGKSGEVIRRVYANIELAGPFEHCILTKEAMILKSDTLIGGYNSLDPADTDVEVQIGTISTLPDQIVLNNNVTVEGEVIVGVDGNPGTVIKDLGGTTGDRYAMGEEPPLPQITPPILPDIGTSIYAKGTTLTIGPADSGQYTGIELWQESEKIKGTTYEYPAILEIASGDVVLHITGDIRLGQACEIIVRDKASLTLYVDGDITCGNDSGMTNEGSPKANKLKLYGTGKDKQNFDIKAKSNWCGAVYAPNAQVDLYANGDGYGSIVANGFEFKAGGNLYYDEALRDVTIYDEGVRFVIKQWHEE